MIQYNEYNDKQVTYLSTGYMHNYSTVHIIHMFTQTYSNRICGDYYMHTVCACSRNIHSANSESASQCLLCTSEIGSLNDDDDVDDASIAASAASKQC